jgi:hypothetical protein
MGLFILRSRQTYSSAFASFEGDLHILERMCLFRLPVEVNALLHTGHGDDRRPKWTVLVWRVK